MVTKERLQELIEKEEVIWSVSPYNEAFEMCLTGDVKIRDDCALQFGSSYIETYMISDLYETQAEAEWVAQMHAQRTQYFQPPTWEEFEKDPKFSFWVNKFDGLGGLYCIEKTTDIVFDKYGNEVEKQYLDIYATLIENHKTGSGYFYRRDYTKDNYINACEYARNLFLGKENENE